MQISMTWNIYGVNVLESMTVSMLFHEQVPIEGNVRIAVSLVKLHTGNFAE